MRMPIEAYVRVCVCGVCVCVCAGAYSFDSESVFVCASIEYYESKVY